MMGPGQRLHAYHHSARAVTHRTWSRIFIVNEIDRLLFGIRMDVNDHIAAQEIMTWALVSDARV